MSEFEIKREDGETGGRYVTLVNGHEAEMTYSKAVRSGSSSTIPAFRKRSAAWVSA